MDDDGTQPFGHSTHNEAPHWDTPDWRAEMEARYAEAPMPRQIAFDADGGSVF